MEDLQPNHEIELDGETYEPSGITHSTACEHEWAVDDRQDPNSDMVSYRCVNCWAGMSIAKDKPNG